MSLCPSVHIERLVSCSTELSLCWGYLLHSKESIVSHNHHSVINLAVWTYFLSVCSFISPAELVFWLVELVLWVVELVFSVAELIFLAGELIFSRAEVFCHRLNALSDRLQFTLQHRTMTQGWWTGIGRKLLCPFSRHCPRYHVEKLRKAMSNWSEQLLGEPRSEEYMHRQEAEVFGVRASLYIWPQECVSMQRYRWLGNSSDSYGCWSNTPTNVHI